MVQWNAGIIAKTPEMAGVFKMLNAASRGILFKSELIKAIVPSIESLYQLSGVQFYLGFLDLLVSLSNCEYMALSASEYVDALPQEHSSRMIKVYDFVNENYQRKIYLREVAQKLHMSEQTFSRFFSKSMGRSFFRFLNEYRINIAANKLVDTDSSVEQIGYACGFESLPFFYKQFNLQFDTSPLKYRKQFQ